MHSLPMDEAAPPDAVAGEYQRVFDVCESGALPNTISAEASALLPCERAAKRFRQEHAWLKSLPGIDRTISSLLAARIVGCLMGLRPRDYGAWRGEGKAPSGLSSLRPDRAALEESAAALRLESGRNDGLTPQQKACLDALWPLAAPTEYLLSAGGDDRLTLDPVTGTNKYGCTPWPRPDMISFSSCTASSLSEGAFAAAERARRSLVSAALATSPATALTDASEAISLAVLQHFGVEDLAEAVLAASGTDAALVVTGLLAAERPHEALTSILVSPSETGSGVPNAVQGRHFASCAPSGNIVGKGEPIDGLVLKPALVTVALRDLSGAPRTAAAIEADFEAAIETGIAAGHVVLHAIDGSKTGLTAPDRGACRRLADKYSPKLDIVIDACQARIEPDLVRWYLRHGFPVLVTGSKFFTAPGFCGAVLFPRIRLHRIARAGRLPTGLAAYARLQGGFGSRRCPGLIMRWTAALHEMAIFNQMPARMVSASLDCAARAITFGLSQDFRLGLVAAPRPSGMGWSDRRSVFTFTVSTPAGLMSPKQLRGIYNAMGEDCSGRAALGKVICQIGQPVGLGTGDMGALRIAVSAAQIASCADLTERMDFVFAKLASVLDRTSSSAC